MKGITNKSLYLLLGFSLAFVLSIITVQSVAADTTTYKPNEKKTGLVKNPGMGWVLYCDAFHQMTNPVFPDMNRCTVDQELFWKTFDESGATDKASTFYIRAPWSYFEPEDGKYAWEHDENYKDLIQHALDKGLKLSFRVYMDSQDSWQQATPEYVRDLGAKGYINTFWNPYINDEVFIEKFTEFIEAFGEEYNDPSKVDFIDAMGIGAWGEGHNIKRDRKQPGNVDTTLEIITETYRRSFDKVLLGGQQGGKLASQAEILVHSNKYDILRRDSLGMPKHFKKADKDYYVNQMLSYGIPLFAENGWNYFAHDFAGYMANNGRPFSNIRDMLEASMSDAINSRANTFDFRVPEDAIEWMKNEDLVNEFVDNGGYRFVPTLLKIPMTIDSNDYLSVKSEWKNTGIGRMPNNRTAWGFKYKLAYALLDPSTGLPVFTEITNVDPSDWLKGNNYIYESNISFGDIPNGVYDFAYAIVDTANGNKPAINLAITEDKTNLGWYKVGQTNVTGIENASSLPKLSSYRLAEDMTDIQGENQWYYLEARDASYLEMQWNNDENSWIGTNNLNVIRKNTYIHPANKDTVIGWKSIKEGEVSIKGNPKKQNLTCGDGVNVKIYKNDTQIWPSNGWKYIGASDGIGLIHDLSITVEPDDMIYFIVNKGGTTNCDGMIWNPVIEYTNFQFQSTRLDWKI